MTPNHPQNAQQSCEPFLGKSIFGSFLGHFRAQIWPFEGVSGSKNDQKLAQNSLKWPQTTPKMVRNDVGTFLEKSIFGHFGVILGSFWGHFGVILGSFWVILGHFGSFWVILGHFEPNKWPNIAYKSLTWPQTILMARKMAQNRIFSHFVWKIRIFTNFAITDFKIG